MLDYDGVGRLLRMWPVAVALCALAMGVDLGFHYGSWKGAAGLGFASLVISGWFLLELWEATDNPDGYWSRFSLLDAVGAGLAHRHGFGLVGGFFFLAVLTYFWMKFRFGWTL